MLKKIVSGMLAGNDVGRCIGIACDCGSEYKKTAGIISEMTSTRYLPLQ